jgi:predicted nucleotidyltransferase
VNSNDRLLIYKAILLDIIEKYLVDCTVLLFGSRARGTNQEGADIDIAIDIGSSIAHSVMTKIRSDIEESNIPVCVDVVDVHSASERIKERIKKDGIVWRR